MVFALVVVVMLGADSPDSSALGPDAFVEQIQSRLQTFEDIPNLYLVMESPTTYGTRRLEYGRLESGVFLAAEYQDWITGRPPELLGEESRIALQQNGWVKELYRDPSDTRVVIRYSQTPPEPHYELRIMLGFGHWTRPDEVRAYFLGARRSVRAMPPQTIDDDPCVGIEVTYPTRWGNEEAEHRGRLWFIPAKGMALKRYETLLTSNTRSEKRRWDMSEFVELTDGFWMATRAHVHQVGREFDVRMADWDLGGAHSSAARYALEPAEGAEVVDTVFHEDFRWKEGWTIPEILLGEKGCGPGLRADEFRLSAAREESLAQALAQAVPATFKGVCRLGFAEDFPELARHLREFMPAGEGDGAKSDSLEKGTLGIALAPLDKRHAVALFSVGQKFSTSDWAILYQRAPFRNAWKVLREGRKHVITADPPGFKN